MTSQSQSPPAGDELYKILADLEGYGIKVGFNPNKQYTSDRLNAAVAKLNAYILAEVLKELKNTLTMNGWHEGDWKQAITERVTELEATACFGAPADKLQGESE
jgi:hypothetical protein